MKNYLRRTNRRVIAWDMNSDWLKMRHYRNGIFCYETWV